MKLGQRAVAALLVVLALVLSGCAREAAESASLATRGPEDPRTREPEDPRPRGPESDWASEVRLVSLTYDEWQRELESYRGSIVVVDYWATWCAPCLERFPKMVEMAETYRPKGARFVSMSLDDRDDEDSIPHVMEVLRKNDARIPNYLMNEIIPDAFEKLDLLGIPAVFVYDETGTLRHRLTGDNPNDQFTEKDVEEAVKGILEE